MYMKPLLLCTLALILVACGGAERKEKHRQKAEDFYQLGDFEKSRLEYKNVVLIDPKDLQGHLWLAKVQEKLGNLPTAVGEYKNVLQLDENHLEAKVGLGYLYAMAGSGEAAQLANDILASNPDHSDGLVIAAMVSAREGQMNDAIGKVNRAMSFDPLNIKGGLLLSNLHLNIDQIEMAESAIEPLLAEFPEDLSLLNQQARLMWKQSRYAETVAALKKTLEIQPGNLTQYAFLSGVQLKQGNKAAAEQVLQDAVVALPDALEPKFMLVDFQLKEMGPEVAEKQLKHFIEQTSDADLQLTLASIYQKTGQLELAEKTYDEIVAGDAPLAALLRAKNRLALMYAARQEQSEASALLEEILDESPKDQNALTLRGKLALGDGDTEKAINDFRAVLKQAPESVPIRRLLAKAQTQAENLELAMLNLQKAGEIANDDVELKIETARLHLMMKQDRQAKTILDEVLRADPNHIQASKAMVALQLQQNDEQGAIGTLKTLQKSEEDSAYGHYLEGRLHQSKRDLDKSNASLERALIKRPGAVEPMVALVTNYLAQKNTVGAERVLDRALSANPKHVVAHNLLGEIRMSSGQFKEAERAFSQAIDEKPDWWVPYRNLATLFLRQNRGGEALDILKKASESNPDSSRLQLELALLQAGQGHRREAIEVYDGMLNKDAENTPALNNLAMLLVDDGSSSADRRRAKALSDRLPEDNPLMLDTKAWVLHRNGHTSQAIELVEKALEIMPESADVNFHYALMLEAQGATKEAEQYLKKALLHGAKGFPDFKKAETHLKRLQAVQ